MKLFTCICLVIISEFLLSVNSQHVLKKRQLYREQVLPHAGGKIPDSAFQVDRLALNRLQAEGIAVPDGVLLEQRKHPVFPYAQKTKRPTFKVALTPSGKYTASVGVYRYNQIPSADTTYAIPQISGHPLRLAPKYPVKPSFGILELPSPDVKHHVKTYAPTFPRKQGPSITLGYNKFPVANQFENHYRSFAPVQHYHQNHNQYQTAYIKPVSSIPVVEALPTAPSYSTFQPIIPTTSSQSFLKSLPPSTSNFDLTNSYQGYVPAKWGEAQEDFITSSIFNDFESFFNDFHLRTTRQLNGEESETKNDAKETIV